MKILIEKKIISLTKENYTGIKKEHPQLLLAFVEKTPENEKLAKVLEATGLISSTALKGDKIEIHQRKK